MSGRPGPETRLVARMRKAAVAEYGDRYVATKYHGGAFGETGVSDLLGVLDSIMFACEVKAPESYPLTRNDTYASSVEKALEEGPTLKQRAYLKRISDAGGVATVAATVEQYMATLAFCVEREIGWHDFRAVPRDVLEGTFK